MSNDVRVRHLAQGEWLMLNYAAANMDPAFFEDPMRFDVARRNASKHITFGSGIHFCLGAQLARQELRSLFGHLVPRLASVELAGEGATGKATFVSGYKSLPIRYTHPRRREVSDAGFACCVTNNDVVQPLS